MSTLHVFDFLQGGKQPLPPVCAIFGDEGFLKTLARQEIRRRMFADEPDAPFTTFNGEEAEWRDVVDEVATVALFGGDQRLVFVDDADKFVTRFRDRLQDYVDQPSRSGVLVLIVSTWASTTNLYKALDQSGLQIDCRLPQTSGKKKGETDEARLAKWLTAFARDSHRLKMPAPAMQALLDLVGPEIGLLNQALAKLALFVEPGGEVTPEMVRDVVGGWRAKTAWELLDFACDGNSAAALRELDRLLQAGEVPIGLFGIVSWSLRRFAIATRIFEQAEREGRNITLTRALEQAGVKSWQGALAKAERQLKQIGRERAGQLLRWLLDADLALKGSHSTDERARQVLELLFLRLDQRLNPTALAARSTAANLERRPR